MRMNWRAENHPSTQALEEAELLCIVKKPDYRVIEKFRKLGKPVVFDIVDSWGQPADEMIYNNKQKCLDFFSGAWKLINADGYIFPTFRMYSDLGALVQDKIVIYHHYKPQLLRNPVRRHVSNVGYEGGDYLGEWQPLIERECNRRGLRFLMNPSNYLDLDILFLARGGGRGNFLPRTYKSNVKLANAIGSGTPALVHFEEMSAHDVDTGDVFFFTDHPGSMQRQLDRLVDDYSLRLQIHQNFLDAASRFHITHIADQFEGFFLNVLEKQRKKNA